MKKRILMMMVLVLAGMFVPPRAQAFLLPPFKTDGSMMGQTGIENVNKAAEQAQAKISEAQKIQTTVQQGTGGEFSQIMEGIKTAVIAGVAVMSVSSLAKELKDLHKKESEEVDKNNAEIDNVTVEADAKVVEYDKNIHELEEELAKTSDPSKKAKLQKKITKLRSKKAKVREDQEEKVKGLTKASSIKLGDIKGMIGDVTGSLKSKVSGLFKNKVGKNDDPTPLLKDTDAINNVPEGTPVTSTVAVKKKRFLKKVHLSGIFGITSRSAAIRTSIAKNDDTADKTTEASGTPEGANDAMIIAAIESKKQVMQSLVDYTEMLLHQIKLQITYDMATGAFQAYDKKSATSAEFDFENYRFNPETTETKEETEKAKDEKGGETIAGSLTEASKKALKETMQGNSEQGEK